MDKEKAVEILVQGVKIGQKMGAYSLEESSILLTAINTLKTNATDKVKEQKGVQGEHQEGSESGKAG